MFFYKNYVIIYIENEKGSMNKMKIWSVTVPNAFNGMSNTSLFINEEEAKDKFDRFKDRGATMGRVDDIWNF